jgi:hypothetical protein
MWPTPRASENDQGRKADGMMDGISSWKAQGRGATLTTAVKRCATPTARDWKSGKASDATMERNSRPLSEQIGGSLNPTWVELLMGWPANWTDLKPLGSQDGKTESPESPTA